MDEPMVDKHPILCGRRNTPGDAIVHRMFRKLFGWFINCVKIL